MIIILQDRGIFIRVLFQNLTVPQTLNKFPHLTESVGSLPCSHLTTCPCPGPNHLISRIYLDNIKECMLDIISDLVGKVEKRARKPWITQEMISNMSERRKWKNVNNEEGRRNYRRLRNELKKATEMAKKGYLENICNEIIEFQRTGRSDLMYTKTKELGWIETQGIQSIGIEDSQGNRIVDQRQVLKIWENYITELYDRPNRPETQTFNLKKK